MRPRQPSLLCLAASPGIHQKRPPRVLAPPVMAASYHQALHTQTSPFLFRTRHARGDMSKVLALMPELPTHLARLPRDSESGALA